MKKMLRGGALAASVALVLGLCLNPSAAFAEQTHNIARGEVRLYSTSPCMKNGVCEGHVITGSTADTDHKLLIESGAHNVTLNGVTIDFSGSSAWQAHSPVAVADGATLNLNLSGSNVVKAHTRWGDLNSEAPGILVPSGATLTIDGAGTLEARADGAGTTGQSGAAGIGGGYNQDFGTIVISGGKVNAYGVDGGAGIGSGYFLGSGMARGNVTINGGFVRAYGGSRGASSAAGIGAGENGDYAGTITINGGVVHAMGGDEDQSSIGGGGRGIGASNNGTFTTGTDGNAIILAPYGIGDRSQLSAWDCILLDQTEGSHVGEDNLTYSEDAGGKVTVTFGGGTPQVYGNVKMDYNLVVNSPVSLRITTETDVDDDPSTLPNPCSTLTMTSGSTLTNNNGTDTDGGAGVALESGTRLILEDSVSQLKGSGKMVSLSGKHGPGKVQLTLTEELVKLNPAEFTYDGKAKEPAVSVVLDVWGYRQTFVNNTDYTFQYEENINAGTATVAVSSASELLHNQKAKQVATANKEFTIHPADLVVSTVAKRYVVKREDQLLSKLPTMPTFGKTMPVSVKRGTLGWYADQDCTQPLTDAHVAQNQAGDQVTVYWKYVQGDTNYEREATGSTLLVITDGTPPEVQVDGETDNAHVEATYGDPEHQLMVKIKRPGESEFIEPLSHVSYQVTEQKPAASGAVVSVSDQGSVTFLGAGTATIMAEIEGYTDPGTVDGNGNYGPAFVTITVTVSPKDISVDESSVHATDRAFDGTHDVAVTASLTASDLVFGDEGKVGVSAAGTVESVNASDTPVAVEVAYTLTGDKADDYTLINAPGTTVKISKANAVDFGFTAKTTQRVIYNKIAGTYRVNLGQTIIPDAANGVLPYVNGFKITDVEFDKAGYFAKDDVSVNQANSVLTLKTQEVDSSYEGRVAAITVELNSVNFTGLKGTVEVVSKNADVHTITAEAGPNGTVSPTELKVISGRPAELTITPDKGYEIDVLTVDGYAVEDYEQYITDGVLHIDKVTVDHHIKVTFKSDGSVTPPTPEHTITATAGEGGSISPSGKVSVANGSSQRFEFKANDGFIVGEVLVDDKAVNAEGFYEFTDVKADHTIKVTFMKSDSGPSQGGDSQGAGDPDGDNSGPQSGDHNADGQSTSTGDGNRLPGTGDSAAFAVFATLGVGIVAVLSGAAIALQKERNH